MRNILVTSPRVTQLKLDPDDTQVIENGENAPPVHSNGSESNQMAIEKTLPDFKSQVLPEINSNANSMEVTEDVSVSNSWSIVTMVTSVTHLQDNMLRKI